MKCVKIDAFRRTEGTNSYQCNRRDDHVRTSEVLLYPMFDRFRKEFQRLNVLLASIYFTFDNRNVYTTSFISTVNWQKSQ